MVINISEVISEFGYTSIFFGREPELAADPSVNKSQMDVRVEQLLFDLAAEFLELCISTIHHLISFCEQATLRYIFYALYSVSGSYDPCSQDSTPTLAVLAIGATLTDNPLWANVLLAQIESNLDSWDDAVSLRVV